MDLLPIHDFAVFLAAGLLLNVTPGADMLYVVSRGAGSGFRAGAAAAAGIFAGCLLHIAFAAAGLSALLATSATAFAVVRLVGAAYLVWLGITAIRQAGQAPAGPQRLEPARLAVVFRQGALVNALNPKVALFFLAFLPQFIEPAAADAPLAMAALGLVFNLTGLGCNLLVAWSAAGLARRIRAGGRLTAWLKRAVGTVFVALGLKLALAERAA